MWKIRECFWYAEEGLRPVLASSKISRKPHEMGQVCYIISGVYDFKTHAHLFSDLTDFSCKNNLDTNIALVLYSFLASKIM